MFLVGLNAKQWLSQHEPLRQVSSDVNDLHSLASGELSARVLLPWFIECLLQVRHIQFDAFGAVFLSSSFFLWLEDTSRTLAFLSRSNVERPWQVLHEGRKQKSRRTNRKPLQWVVSPCSANCTHLQGMMPGPCCFDRFDIFDKQTNERSFGEAVALPFGLWKAALDGPSMSTLLAAWNLSSDLL